LPEKKEKYFNHIFSEFKYKKQDMYRVPIKLHSEILIIQTLIPEIQY